MEPTDRTKMIDVLLEETAKKIQALATTLTAQGAQEEQNALRDERTWWEKAHQELADARQSLEQAAIYERSRGASG
jgi:hypothetical protein